MAPLQASVGIYEKIDDDDELYVIPFIDLTADDDDDTTSAVGPVPIASVKLRSPKARYGKSATSLEEQHESFTLQSGAVVRVGETVELKKPEVRDQGLQSGDFLRVVKIVKLVSDQKIILRGHILMREKYILGRGSDGKTGRLNELVMHFKMHEYDNRPPQIQGLVDVSLEDIAGKRDVIFTTKPFPKFSWRETPSCYAQTNFTSKVEGEEFLFHVGPLVCRWSRTDIVSPNGKVYGGEMKYLRGNELWVTSHHGNCVANLKDRLPSFKPSSVPRANPPDTAILGKRSARSSSLELSDLTPPKGSIPLKRRVEVYTVFDLLCGGGGGSRGAADAGLLIIAGLDKNEIAIEAWQMNNTGALPFCMCAFVFFEKQLYKVVGRIDILIICCPCQPYCPAHTIPGKHDEQNIKALEILKLAIDRLKPRMVVFENTYGLSCLKKNRPYMNKVLRDIMNAGGGYNVKYGTHNTADFEVAQERKRLIIVAARRGLPLPAYPKPKCGPQGSGLKPYVSIQAALQSLEQHPASMMNDPYHQPDQMRKIDAEPYDASTRFVDCIMTSGVKSHHPSGKRKFTPRELARLQSLPDDHHLTGSPTQAIKQVGNMFSPKLAEHILRSCAQTLEAYDHGLIDENDDIDDLELTLLEKGHEIRPSQYRYLTPPELNDVTNTHFTSYAAPRANWFSPRTPEQKRAKKF